MFHRMNKMLNDVQTQFELEQVGLLWEQIHDTHSKLYDVKIASDDDEIHFIFKFKKVTNNG